MRRPWARRPEPSISYDIIDLPERHESSYFVCLEDWSDEMREAGDLKRQWYERNRDRGLRVKLAVDESDTPIGMIQYVPIELSPVTGENAYMILCIWVHGYRQGVGDVQRRGVGSALLRAAEDDARVLGADGIAAWGLRIPVWMKSSWFRSHGYEVVDRAAVRDLVWKPFTPDAVAPQWIPEQPVAIGDTGAVQVTAYVDGWCPAANLVVERAKRVAAELGDDVDFTTIDTSTHEDRIRCGHSDEVFVDGRPLQRGAPPSYAAIKRRIGRRLRRHARSST